MLTQKKNNTSPFDEASKVITKLQKEHKRLTEAIPKIKAVQEEADLKLTKTLKELSEVEIKLEKLKQAIIDQTEKYNKWQTNQYNTLNEDKDAFEKSKTAATVELQTKFAEAQQLLEHAQDLITKANEDRTLFNEEKQELSEKVTANIKWAERLAESESNTAGKLEAIEKASTELETRVQELDLREKAIIRSETAASKALQDAETAKTGATTILQGAKEKVAIMDAREDALNHKENVLNRKARDIAAKEDQINKRLLDLKTRVGL